MLRLLTREPQAVVDRQPVVHLPVVLHVELGVVVDHAAFDEPRLLQVLREHADRGVGETEAGVERVVRVVAEVDVALEPEVGDAARAGVLRLEAVVVVEPGLERVRVPHLRHADGDVLRAVDVEEPGEDLIRRSGQRPDAGGAHDAAAPAECRRHVDPLPVPPDRIQIVEHSRTRSSAGRRSPAPSIEQREIRQARQPVRRVRDEDAAGAGGADRGAACELIADEPVGALDERRIAHRVVHGDAVVGDERIRVLHVVEPGDRARRDQASARADPSTCRVTRRVGDSW